MHAWPSVLPNALPLNFISSLLDLSGNSFTILQAILFRDCFVFCSSLPYRFIRLRVLSQLPHEILELFNASCSAFQGSLLELRVVSLLCVELLTRLNKGRLLTLKSSSGEGVTQMTSAGPPMHMMPPLCGTVLAVMEEASDRQE